jgi:hypothetical protein
MLYIEAKNLICCTVGICRVNVFTLEWLAVLLYSEGPELFLEAYPDMFVMFFLTSSKHIYQDNTLD